MKSSRSNNNKSTIVDVLRTRICSGFRRTFSTTAKIRTDGVDHRYLCNMYFGLRVFANCFINCAFSSLEARELLE